MQKGEVCCSQSWGRSRCKMVHENLASWVTHVHTVLYVCGTCVFPQLKWYNFPRWFSLTPSTLSPLTWVAGAGDQMSPPISWTRSARESAARHLQKHWPWHLLTRCVPTRSPSTPPLLLSCLIKHLPVLDSSLRIYLPVHLPDYLFIGVLHRPRN